MRTITIEGDAMPVLGLGTWQLEGADCCDAIRSALDMGYRHIDTATMYGNEAEIGQELGKSDIPRDQLWITSKIRREHLHHDDVLASIDKSLERLACDYLDLALIHWPNEDVPLRETMLALKEIRKEGRIRHIGVSNFTPSQVREARELAPIITNQVECHLFLQQHEMYELLRSHEMVLTAYSPLARGGVEEDETVQRLADKHDASPEQIAIAWQLHREAVVAIPKASSEKHLRSNMEALSISLDDEDLETVRSLDRGERIIDPEFAPAWGT
ncbi:MAG: aldo/keto reductase [Planctomycetota bacterium]